MLRVELYVLYLMCLVFVVGVYLLVSYVARVFSFTYYEKVCKDNDTSSVIVSVNDHKFPRRMTLADYVLDVKSREFFCANEVGVFQGI
jgi:hypothetical protein